MRAPGPIGAPRPRSPARAAAARQLPRGRRSAAGRAGRHRGVFWRPACDHCGAGGFRSTHKVDGDTRIALPAFQVKCDDNALKPEVLATCCSLPASEAALTQKELMRMQRSQMALIVRVRNLERLAEAPAPCVPKVKANSLREDEPPLDESYEGISDTVNASFDTEHETMGQTMVEQIDARVQLSTEPLFARMLQMTECLMQKAREDQSWMMSTLKANMTSNQEALMDMLDARASGISTALAELAADVAETKAGLSAPVHGQDGPRAPTPVTDLGPLPSCLSAKEKPAMESRRSADVAAPAAPPTSRHRRSSLDYSRFEGLSVSDDEDDVFNADDPFDVLLAGSDMEDA